jgi:hypothetical protein
VKCIDVLEEGVAERRGDQVPLEVLKLKVRGIAIGLREYKLDMVCLDGDGGSH